MGDIALMLLAFLLVAVGILAGLYVVGALQGNGAGKVARRELANGVHPDLAAFLDWWDSSGPFELTLAYPDARWSYVAPAGVRTPEEQEAARAAGLSNAGAGEGPHPRGAAVDCWPVEFDPSVPWSAQPLSIKAKFSTYGALAEARGLKWGGRWVRFGASGAGDQPHVEVPHWSALPVISSSQGVA